MRSAELVQATLEEFPMHSCHVLPQVLTKVALQVQVGGHLRLAEGTAVRQRT